MLCDPKQNLTFKCVVFFTFDSEPQFSCCSSANSGPHLMAEVAALLDTENIQLVVDRVSVICHVLSYTTTGIKST